MKTKTPVPKSPKEIAELKLQDNLSLLSANAFSASALVYTNGGYVQHEEIEIFNAHILRMIQEIGLIQATLDKTVCTPQAKKDGS